MWIAELSSTQVVGGSLLCDRSELLTAQAGAVLNVVRNAGSLPHVIVVEEALTSGNFVYHGLTVDGRWIASAPQAQQATASHHGDQYTLLELGGSTNVIAFMPWELVAPGWQDLSAAGPQTIETNRFLATLNDGSRIVGYSPFAQLGARPGVAAPSATFAPGTGPSERNHHTWTNGVDALFMFGANPDRWIRMNTTVASPTVDHGVMTTVVTQGTQLSFYSAMTGTIAQHPFAAPVLTQGGYVDVVQDTAQVVIHRAVDNGLLVLPFGAGNSTIIEQDYAGVVRGTDYEMVSGVIIGPTATLSLPTGASEVARDASETVFLLQTDEPAIHAYSSMTNQWSRIDVPAGFTVASLVAEHAVGQVVFEQRDGGGALLAQTFAGYSPRLDNWQSLNASTTAVLDSSDGLLTAHDNGTLFCFGTESQSWTSTALPGGTQVTDGLTGDFAYDLTLDGSGGTTLTTYSRITDKFCTGTIPFVVTNPATEVYVLEQGLIVNDTTAGVVYSYGAFGDLASQHTWPMATMPAHFNIGCPPERFVASGRPFMLNSLVVGVVRDPGFPFPPALGLIQMALFPEPKLSPIGVMDARGCVGYSLDIPGIVPRQAYYLQSLNIDPNAPFGREVSWGDYLYTFQIH